jgi:serine protease inhibitor
MRRLTPPCVAVAGLGLLVACGGGDVLGPIEGLPRELSIAEGQLIEADNRFAFKLFREISRQEGDSNIFISPLSAAMALGMTYNGAAGSTQVAMQEVLELQGMGLQEVNESYRSLIDLLRNLDPRVEFLLANSIWYRQGYPIEQEFLDLNREYFDAEVAALDFSSPAAPGTINAWVRENTANRIDSIVVGPISPLTVMYLINAIYFKGDWVYQFDRNLTMSAPFMLKDGSETLVPMMSHGGKVEIGINWADGVVLGDIAYGGGAYSMTVLLPTTASDIDSLVTRLTQENWDRWIAGLGSTEIEVQLPKFTLEYAITLNDVLTALGMGIAFDPGRADFSRMYAGGGVYIDSVVQKTFVDVNEEGTEAAAVTSVVVGRSSAGTSFVVDRPFLFVIRERYSGAIMFMGKILDPTG